MAQPIGALMAQVRTSDEMCDDIYENWVHDSQVVPMLCAHDTSLSAPIATLTSN